MIVKPIDQIDLVTNDLDFVYCPAIKHTAVPDSVRYSIVFDCTQFFTNNGGHLVFSLDNEPSNDPLAPHKPHCGPILRRGYDMYSFGRGAIIHGDGRVETEEWTGGAPILYPITNTGGTGYNPMTNPVGTFIMNYRYATGGMDVKVYKGVGATGTPMFSGSYTTPAKPWIGRTRAAFGAIGWGFVPPADTGCIEEVLPRASANAKCAFTGFHVQTLVGNTVLGTSVAR